MQHPGALNNRGLKSFPLLSGTKILSDLTGCNRAIGRGTMEFVESAIAPSEIPLPDIKQSPFSKVPGRTISVFVHREFPSSTDLIHALLLFQSEQKHTATALTCICTNRCYHEGGPAIENKIRLDS